MTPFFFYIIFKINNMTIVYMLAIIGFCTVVYYLVQLIKMPFNETEKKSKYPCIIHTEKGYHIARLNNSGDIEYCFHYGSTSDSWFTFIDDYAIFKTLEDAKKRFDHYYGSSNIKPLGRVYGLENLKQEIEIKSEIQVLEDIISKDQENGEDTHVLERILLRKEEKLII